MGKRLERGAGRTEPPHGGAGVWRRGALWWASRSSPPPPAGALRIRVPGPALPGDAPPERAEERERARRGAPHLRASPEAAGAEPERRPCLLPASRTRLGDARDTQSVGGRGHMWKSESAAPRDSVPREEIAALRLPWGPGLQWGRLWSLGRARLAFPSHPRSPSLRSWRPRAAAACAATLSRAGAGSRTAFLRQTLCFSESPFCVSCK